MKPGDNSTSRLTNWISVDIFPLLTPETSMDFLTSIRNVPMGGLSGVWVSELWANIQYLTFYGVPGPQVGGPLGYL